MLSCNHQDFNSCRTIENHIEKPYHFHLQFECIHSWQSIQPVMDRRNFGHRRQCSIVHNSQLLSNMSTCNPVTFDGSLNITQKGSLGSICDAYYHKDIIANILSVSAITSQGHIHAYDNTADSFFISYPGGLLYLHSPGVTMDYMYVTLVIHMLL